MSVEASKRAPSRRDLWGIETLALVRWFRGRYPDVSSRLAYARRALQALVPGRHASATRVS